MLKIMISTTYKVIEKDMSGGYSGHAMGTSAFGTELRRVRDLRGLSQLDLSLRAEVSQRHVSFLETGRARPSRRMIGRLGRALELPLRERNRLLLAAGFAAVYGETALDDREMARVRKSIDFLLRRHEPYPAFVLDRAWNIVLGNRPHLMMLERLRTAIGFSAEDPENALELLLAPDRLRPAIRSWPRLAATLMQRLDRQATATCTPDLLALRQKLLAFDGVREALAQPPPEDGAPELLVPFEIDFAGVRLSWYTTIASFGGALDATTQEVVIESLLPADEATEAFALELGPAS